MCLLDRRPELVERWLAQRGGQAGQVRRPSVTSELAASWLTASPFKRSKSPSRPRESREWRRRLGLLDEGELFMELIRDVSNELDIDVLCHKILVNVGLLTRADRGSLFLARGAVLVAKLFDVTVDTELEEAVKKAREEEIKIPFGVGVAGVVAQSKKVINIRDAYKDPRFNSEIDMRTGYKTNTILCGPISNYEGEVIGVAQIINKTDGSFEFSERDVEGVNERLSFFISSSSGRIAREKYVSGQTSPGLRKRAEFVCRGRHLSRGHSDLKMVFQRYLTFCGIGIQNAQLFEMSVQEFKRNQILLNLARSIFEEQSNLERLVTKIMTEARDLLKCESCAVFLLDNHCAEEIHLESLIEKPALVVPERKPLCRRESNNVNVEEILSPREIIKLKFTIVFELRSESQKAIVYAPNQTDLGKTRLAQIAKYVATTGQILNIGDVSSWMNEDITGEGDGVVARCILCMPIINGQKQVIGVAQLINKETGQPFTDCDVSIFEAFAIFCGLGIHNTQMYENACKLMAKQKVALECLSYHATASLDDTTKLYKDPIPSAEKYNLFSYKFIDFDLTDEDTCKATIRMFLECNLVEQYHIPYDVLCRWVLSVKKNYRPVKYHNWRHALNVAQTMFAMLKTGKMERFMNDLEILGLLVACLCHDLDHRGTNNAFQTKTESPLAILYTTSTMEHHHFDQCVMILNSEGNNIFQALSPEDYRYVMKVVEHSILSTDLAMYFKKKSSFLELIENGEFDWQSEGKKELLCGMMMTACDVGAIAKPWEVQHKVAKLVADEFFDQGDLEKLQLNTQPVAMMDRERKDELPQMQVGFIDVICLPLYKVLSDTFPWILPLYEGTLENRKHWQDLAEKVEMGLTWIDHDTIEKPIEEFTGEDDAKEIEFTVTTLNCDKKVGEGDGVPGRRANGSSIGRFASLRKNRTLGKSVRTRISRSLYSKSTSTSTQEKSEPTSEAPQTTKAEQEPSKSQAVVPQKPKSITDNPQSG